MNWNNRSKQRTCFQLCFILAVFFFALPLHAQPFDQGNRGNNFFGGNNNGNQNVIGGAGNGINQGGAAQADFDSLIELIEATIAPDTWESVGGNGTIQGFPGGVFVDATGVMNKVDSRIQTALAKHFRKQNAAAKTGQQDAFQESQSRKVSLRKLQQAVRQLAEKGLSPTQEMQYLAGLMRIDFLVIDEENADVLLVGPAGKWMIDPQGRVVNFKNRRPVLQLDDLVVLLRNSFAGPGQFTCSITPTQKNLANAQAFIDESSGSPIKKGQTKRWVESFRNRMGNQRIEVHGVPSGSRLARVIVEADYHMKLIGIGLEPGTPGVVSYLDLVEIPIGGSAPPLDVLRWWFTLSDASISSNASRNVFALQKQSVQVRSENELLTKQGKRIHTHEANGLNREFTESFTRHFASLAKRYSIYADLENIFELALVAAIMKHEDVLSRFDWSLEFFLQPDHYQVQLARSPTEVPTVVNHRVIRKKHVVTAVSGGVRVSGQDWITKHVQSNLPELAITTNRSKNPSKGQPNSGKKTAVAWWWD